MRGPAEETVRPASQGQEETPPRGATMRDGARPPDHKASSRTIFHRTISSYLKDFTQMPLCPQRD